jgi:hypothetical protein
MKQIYVPPMVSILVIAAISVGVTVYILHVVSELNLTQAAALQQSDF